MFFAIQPLSASCENDLFWIYSLPRLATSVPLHATRGISKLECRNPKRIQFRDSFSDFEFPVLTGLERAMGIESISLCQSCVILHIFATAKYEKVQGRDGLLSRFVTH